MSNAIDRIKGYCCEVTQAQWEELVRVAHKNGVSPTEYDHWDVLYNVFCIDEEENTTNGYADTELAKREGLTAIPFPDFLAKLRGVEEWMPKAGEMVEVSGEDGHWHSAEYIGLSRDKHIVWTAGWTGAVVTEWPNCRPILPTITRAEAEQQLGKRIID